MYSLCFCLDTFDPGRYNGSFLGNEKAELFEKERMLKNKITFVIFPSNGAEPKQCSVPVKLLWTVGVCSVVFVLANLFLMADYFDGRVDQARLDKLTRENGLIARQYTELKKSIGNIRADFTELVAKEEAIRTIFDLPVIDAEARQLGIGGPTDPDLAFITPATATALAVTSEVEGLARLSAFEKERYQEVFDLLAKKRDRLDHTPSIMPTRGYISRGFGHKNDPFTGVRRLHPGMDIANKTGTPIYAPADGRVSSVRVNGGMGKMIVIDHGYGLKTRYGHLSKYAIKVGQRVKRGEIIAYMGNTGYSTGPHLHYELLKNGKSVNPYKYILYK